MAVPATDVSTVRVNGVDHPVELPNFAPPPTVWQRRRPSLSAAMSSRRRRIFRFACVPSDAGRDDEATIVEEIDLGWRTAVLRRCGHDERRRSRPSLPCGGRSFSPDSWRVALASRLLDAWGVTCLDPRHVVEMGTRFRGFVASGGLRRVLSREVPIIYRVGDRTMSGCLDVVVETPDAIMVVDHKSFPWRPHAVARTGEKTRRTIAPLSARRSRRRCRFRRRLNWLYICQLPARFSWSNETARRTNLSSLSAIVEREGAWSRG